MDPSSEAQTLTLTSIFTPPTSKPCRPFVLKKIIFPIHLVKFEKYIDTCILKFSYNKLCRYGRHPFQDFIQLSAPQLHLRRRAERFFYDLVLSPLQRSHLGVMGNDLFRKFAKLFPGIPFFCSANVPHFNIPN